MQEQPPPVFLTRAQVERRVGLRRTAIYTRMKAGTFPRPVRDGETTTIWWIESEAAAERVIRCYAGQEMDQPARIDDWKFPIIGINQSDDDYWNGVAEQMIRAGVARVRIGAEEYVLPG